MKKGVKTMFSKALFKQSCKANGIMWAIITFAVCFMLACVMLISGSGSIGRTVHAVEDEIVQQEIESAVSSRAINYFKLQSNGMKQFDDLFVSTLENQLPETSQDVQTRVEEVYTQVSTELMPAALAEYAAELGYQQGSNEQQELIACVMSAITSEAFEEFYQKNNEPVPPAYMDFEEINSLVLKEVQGSSGELQKYFSSEEHQEFIKKRSQSCAMIFLAGNITAQENVDKMLEELAKYDISPIKYLSFGYTYTRIKQLAANSIIEYSGRFEYEVGNLDKSQSDYDEKVKEIDEQLIGDISGSLLSSLPEEVAQALEEIGQLNLYGIVVGSIFYKMAGLLLPIIYMIMASNNLIAGQVDSGSMAYVLSTSTKRQTVVFTQALFLIGSLFVMFACTTVTSCICLAIVGAAETGITYKALILLNVGAFLVLFALSGLCFLTSCWFDRSKRSMAIGGGLSIFSLVAAMLGLFGSSVIPSVLRLDELNFFNYTTVISLFNSISILNGSLTFIWQFSILLVLGLVGYIVGALRFIKKDLPL